MKTRSKAPHESQSSGTAEPEKILETAQTPSRIFILPSRVSDAARFVTLPNPSNGFLNRYLFCPEVGLYEFTVVAPATHHPRSVLFAPKADEILDTNQEQRKSFKGAITKQAELMIATPIDLIFFMIPIIAPANPNYKQLFQPLDDILDTREDLPQHLRHVLYNESFRPMLERRMGAICDTVEAGDEKLYRFNVMKLTSEVLAKAECMVSHGLPPSLEERFVRQELEAPLRSVKREDVVTSTTVNTSVSETMEIESIERCKTQSSVTTTATSASTPSDASTPITQPPVDDVLTSDNITRLLRTRIALSFMQSSYLPAHVSAKVDEVLSAPESLIDFKPLVDHLKQLAEFRAEALASRSPVDYDRKRAADDEGESRVDKKRRKEEEEKKKKVGESRGVRDLKKVNTNGMKKMSDFFGKAATKKKS